MTLILSGTNGVSDIDGDASTPAIRGTDANTGIFFGSDVIGFSEGGTECARFNADAQFVAAAGTASLPVITTTGDTNTGIFFPAADTIAFAEGGAEAMRIDSSGNVGVGVTPSAWLSSFKTLQLGTGAALSGRTGTGDAGQYYLSSNAFVNSSAEWKYLQSTFANRHFSDNGAYVWENAASGTAGNTITWTERARIDSSGTLLVGTTTALATNTHTFQALGATSSNYAAGFKQDGGTSSGRLLRWDFPNTSDANAYFLFATNSSGNCLNIFGNGNITNTNNSYGPISDIKFKKDIVDAASQWDDIKNIRIRKFRLKNDPEQVLQIGVIAQEVEEVSPGLVEDHIENTRVTKTREVEKTREVTPAVLDEDGNEIEPAVTETYIDTEEYQEFEDTGETYKTFKASVLYMKAVKALQEAMERIETLEAKVAALEAK